jgi:hypothetical protein
MARAAVRACAACGRGFGLLARRVRCAHCQRLVCAACAAYVAHADDRAAGWRGRAGFCRPCHARILAVEIVAPGAGAGPGGPEPLRVEVNGDPFFALLCLKSEAAQRGLPALADVRFARPNPRTVVATARPARLGA